MQKMSWTRVKLGDILTESKIESYTSDADKRITVRLNIKGVEKRPFEEGVEGGTKYYVRKAGQFIYGKQNLFKGAFGIIPKELDGYESSSDIPTFDVSKNCLAEWIFYFLKQGDFYKSLENIATGTGSRRIQPARLFEVEIPLPSIKVQKAIIENLKIIEFKYERICEELNLQQTYIQQLRQSILQEAVQGKLTEQNPTDEPASKLLERIKAEKQQLIAAGKLKKEKELPPITDDEIPYELPKGWVWCRLQTVSILITDGKHGDSQNETNSGYYFLSAKDVKNGELNYDYARQITYNDFIETHRRTNLEGGDICLVNTGATIGKIAIAKDNELTQRTTFQKSVAIIKLVKNLLVTEYVELFLRSIVPKLMQTSGGSAINNLLLSDIKNLLFPLPPLFEQTCIVTKVQQLMIKIGQLEQEVQQSQKQAQQLLQAVLKEAFRGKIKAYADNEALTMAAKY